MERSNLFLQILENNLPQAVARIAGNGRYPKLSGLVRFYGTPFLGILIEAEISGLPTELPAGQTGFFAMHIHEFGDCTPPFDKTGMHFNPTGQPHPDHAGDLLPLPGNRGYAWYVYYNERLTIDEILGRSVIIHEHRDDFTSQPAGDAGEKIGCGRIVPVRR